MTSAERSAVLGTLLAALLAGAPVAAQPARAPEPRVSFLNGGVTDDEADELRAQASRFPLAIVFGDASDRESPNAFAADVQLTVTDMQGRAVLQHQAAGPILLAELPPGSYQVEATYHGRTKRQNVVIVDGGHRRVGFVWP